MEPETPPAQDPPEVCGLCAYSCKDGPRNLNPNLMCCRFGHKNLFFCTVFWGLVRIFIGNFPAAHPISKHFFLLIHRVKFPPKGFGRWGHELTQYCDVLAGFHPCSYGKMTRWAWPASWLLRWHGATPLLQSCERSAIISRCGVVRKRMPFSFFENTHLIEIFSSVFLHLKKKEQT